MNDVLKKFYARVDRMLENKEVSVELSARFLLSLKEEIQKLESPNAVTPLQEQIIVSGGDFSD